MPNTKENMEEKKYGGENVISHLSIMTPLFIAGPDIRIWSQKRRTSRDGGVDAKRLPEPVHQRTSREG